MLRKITLRQRICLTICRLSDILIVIFLCISSQIWYILNSYSEMKTIIEKRLFWFLKEGSELDLSNKAHLDMYIQQALSRGKTSDIKKLFKTIPPSDFIESFSRVKNFLPKEVRRFWEECLGDINRATEKGTPSV